MLFPNGDVHLRRRAPVTRTFAFKLMDAMRPKAAALAAELVEVRIGLGLIDFVNEYRRAGPRPHHRGDSWHSSRRSPSLHAMDRRLQLKRSASSILTVVMRSRRALWRSTTMLRRYWPDRRASPQEDFLSQYVEATVQGGELSKDEIRTQIVGALF